MSIADGAAPCNWQPKSIEWRNFEQHRPTLKAARDERFYRMWHFYLCASAAGFRAEKNDV
jgi:cyclopropane-fatty-acyl-phospholipid synthase